MALYSFYPKKRGMLRLVSALAMMISLGMLIALSVTFAAAGKFKPSIGPTAENALAADQQLAKAMQENDTTGILRMLDKDWAVIPTTGDIAEGPSIFPDGIRSGYLVRKTFSISEPRVRVYGNMAVVTTKVKLSGVFRGKNFEVMERQTDVWHWKNGAWKCVLTHETKIPNEVPAS